MSESQNSVEKLRTIAEGFEEISGLSEKQALAYTFRSIGGMERQETVMQMDAKPSTVDTHFQRAKQKIRDSRALTYYADIYRGNTSNLREERLTLEGETREGTKLPAIPDQWDKTPFEYKEEGNKVRVFQLPDNRFAKCINRSASREFIEVIDLGSLKIKTADFDPSGFEDYFREEFGIDLSLGKETYITLANDYKTLVEYSVSQRAQNYRISREFKYLEVTRADFGGSPSWMEVNSIDELVNETMAQDLESTEQLRELKQRFLDAYVSEEHARTDPGVYANPEAEMDMQFYEHIGYAFCRATGTNHPLTFDWSIKQQQYSDIGKQQAHRHYKRKYYENLEGRYRDQQIEENLGLDLSGF